MSVNTINAHLLINESKCNNYNYYNYITMKNMNATQ